PLVIAGQGTVGLELEEDAPEADVVVVPVGGAGLISGIVTAIDARVVAVEPEGSAALHEALAAGEPVDVTPRSVADGLNAPFAGANAVAVCTGPGESVLGTEAENPGGFRFLDSPAELSCQAAAA